MMLGHAALAFCPKTLMLSLTASQVVDHCNHAGEKDHHVNHLSQKIRLHPAGQKQSHLFSHKNRGNSRRHSREQTGRYDSLGRTRGRIDHSRNQKQQLQIRRIFFSGFLLFQIHQ